MAPARSSIRTGITAAPAGNYGAASWYTSSRKAPSTRRCFPSIPIEAGTPRTSPESPPSLRRAALARRRRIVIDAPWNAAQHALLCGQEKSGKWLKRRIGPATSRNEKGRFSPDLPGLVLGGSLRSIRLAANLVPPRQARCFFFGRLGLAATEADIPPVSSMWRAIRSDLHVI